MMVVIKIVRLCCYFALWNLVLLTNAEDCVWTGWFDIDNPVNKGSINSGSDSELLSDILDLHPGQVCQNPVEMKVETVDGDILESEDETNNKITIFNPSEGFKCTNEPKNLCKDYKVKFCCPETTAGTSKCESGDNCSEDMPDEKYCCGNVENKYCCSLPCDQEWQKSSDLTADESRKLSESCNYCSAYTKSDGTFTEGFYCNTTFQYSYCCGSLTLKECCSDPTNHEAGSSSSNSSSFDMIDVIIVAVIGVGVAIIIIVGVILYLKLFKTKSSQRRNQTSPVVSIRRASSRLRRRSSRNRNQQNEGAPFPAPPPTYDEVLAEITDAPPPYSPQDSDNNQNRAPGAPEDGQDGSGHDSPTDPRPGQTGPGEAVTSVQVNQDAPTTTEEVMLADGSEVSQGDESEFMLSSLPSVEVVNERPVDS